MCVCMCVSVLKRDIAAWLGGLVFLEVFYVHKHEEWKNIFSGFFFMDEQSRAFLLISENLAILQCVLVSDNHGVVFSYKVAVTVASIMHHFTFFFPFPSSFCVLFFFPSPAPTPPLFSSPHWGFVSGVIRDMHAEIISSIKNLQLDGEDPRKLLQTWGRLRFPRHVLQ